MSRQAIDHIESTKDFSTHSNYEFFQISQIDINWDVSFEKKVLSGSVTHAVKVKSSGADFISFDVRDLDIERVLFNETEADWSIETGNEALGDALRVSLAGFEDHQEFDVTIFYTTSPSASAIQWLTTEQTSGKTHPYLFTQCQAIHARTLLPCQDSPGQKSKFAATVRVDAWATALMSGLMDGVTEETTEDGVAKKVFAWSQPKPIPPYLIALAVGNLTSRDIFATGANPEEEESRVRVWSEPCIIDDCAFEFSQTEDFLATAEELAGPYMWGRYDLLVLPASFPYGGMENPCLTFVTPSLLAGDKSLADVVAHEISHSWTGNLVSNVSWGHFWLNEGWTVWLERKIMSHMQGDDKEVEDFSAHLGYMHLVENVEDFMKAGVPQYTRMCPPLSPEVDPDDVFSSVPYEKGYNFLRYLEELLGEESFKEFTLSYIREFQFDVISSGEFRRFINSYYKADSDSEHVLNQVDWEGWLLSEGNIPVTPSFIQNEDQSSKMQGVKALIQTWTENPATAAANASPADVEGWDNSMICLFLDKVADSLTQSLSCAQVEAMGRHYGLVATRNSEQRFRYLVLGLKVGCASVIDNAVEFLGSIGRMKYTRPLYRVMAASSVPDAESTAKRTFRLNVRNYHPICQKMVASDLGLSLEELLSPSAGQEEEKKVEEKVEEKQKTQVKTPKSTPKSTPKKTPGRKEEEEEEEKDSKEVAPASNFSSYWWLSGLTFFFSLVGVGFYLIRNKKQK
jgi:leukotriene-A4 hydrolase